MTTQNNDLKTRIQSLRERIELEIDISEHNGWQDLVTEWGEHLELLSRVLTPSDSDTAKALEALAQVEEDAHDADLTESIRTCILSLSAQLAEKEGEVERLREANNIEWLEDGCYAVVVLDEDTKKKTWELRCSKSSPDTLDGCIELSPEHFEVGTHVNIYEPRRTKEAPDESK